MSKTQRQQPTKVKLPQFPQFPQGMKREKKGVLREKAGVLNSRQSKRRQQWQSMQPPPKVYPEPEAPRWNPLG
jgi:hypothetical protein